MSQVLSMNVTDLRQKLRRSPLNQMRSGFQSDRRKGADRRMQTSTSGGALGNYRRVWLTPGERTLIEDLYLLTVEEQ